jgi:hypothetical protein
MYALLTTPPFLLLADLGALVIYHLPPTPIANIQGVPILNAAGQPTFVAQPTIGQAEQATVDERFSRARNYWLSYMNIQQAVYKILDDNLHNAFEVLNNPNLIGWNPAMELRNIFNQITTTYGRPMPAALLQNDTLFRSVYSLQDALKVLLHCIKDCQEVQILGDDPYTPQQLLNNAVRLHLQSGLYTGNFED